MDTALDDSAERDRIASDWYGAETATFGDRVAGARDSIGIGQPELARRLGVKVKTLRDWENDLAEPRANKLQMLAGLLGVSIMWLLTGEGDGIEPPVAGGNETPEHLRDLLVELRAVRADMEQSAERVGRIEKRLRQMLAETARDP